MCGRYAVMSAPEAIRALFGYPDQPNFPPRYNIAPTQPIAIVRLVDGKRQFALVRWGLLPPWVKDPKNFSLLINARGESLTDKPAFSAAVKRRRCLVPADGFYEWKASKAGKQPYFVRAKSGGPIAFAGLWETWMGPNGEELETAAIVTTRANRTLGDIHALDEIRRCYADGEEALNGHRVPYVLEDADHRLEVAPRVLVLRRTVVGVELREVLDHRSACGEEAHPFVVALARPRLELVVAPKLGRDKHVSVATPRVASGNIQRLRPSAYVAVEPECP